MMENALTHASSVTGPTALLRLDVPMFLEIEPQILLALQLLACFWVNHLVFRQPILRVVVKVVYLFEGTEVLLRISVTI